VCAHSVEYGKRWILRNALLPRWRKYSVFSGSTEDPMSVVGILSWLHRRPSFTLADEIFSGGYRGDAPERWKRLCRWGMRRSSLSIVNDTSRIPLQREYAKLSVHHPVIVYPGCFRRPPPAGSRAALREAWGIPSDALVLAFSGNFYWQTGAEWFIGALQARTDLHAVLQPADLDALTRFLLSSCRGVERLYIEGEFSPTSDEFWSSMAGVDIGMAIYHHDAPQFQNMGTSSTKICMFLSMGVPVIASRQQSFEFIEKYGCGVLVENEQQFMDAIGFIKNRLPQMKANAIRCSLEYINAPQKYRDLVSALKSISSIKKAYM
jgi:glycosyltransferase involved in cell wall biosynthesis